MAPTHKSDSKESNPSQRTRKAQQKPVLNPLDSKQDGEAKGSEHSEGPSKSGAEGKGDKGLGGGGLGEMGSLLKMWTEMMGRMTDPGAVSLFMNPAELASRMGAWGTAAASPMDPMGMSRLMGAMDPARLWESLTSLFQAPKGREETQAGPFGPLFLGQQMFGQKLQEAMKSMWSPASWAAMWNPAGVKPVSAASAALPSFFTGGAPVWLGLMPTLFGETLQSFQRQASEYLMDFGQRAVLFMDVMRRRGNNMLLHYKAGMPPLLAYDYEVVLDGAGLPRPVNYKLVRIVPPKGWTPGPGRRPLVVIDPRAGHGPGIGGFKEDSEVGMGLREGHPVYFVIFSPMPVPGQTIHDVELAQARFIEEVSKLHPDLGSPVVYGNCQAGWAVAMLGADRPDVTGPIVINGAPMSYWAGGPGINPMRVSAGLLGGSWLTRFLCDLGAGIFDGAHLVSNFESLNPANTLWKKDYNLFAKIDTEAERYLEFERWWTGFFFLNEEEILWIVTNLFVGDKLEQGQLRLSPDHLIDLRKMDDPLVIFASSGDNITPPQQALHWISELYPTTEDLKKAGQRIVYMINPHIGHLGIFVSAKVARKEHRAIIEHIERIRRLEPGLYQMIIERETGEPDPLKDQFEVSFQERDVKQVRFPFDRQAFEKMLAVSRANEDFYLRFQRPLVKSYITPLVAEWLKWTSTARVSRYVWSDMVNPAMKLFETLAEQVKKNRKAVDTSNTFMYAEHRISDNIISLLDAYRDLRDNAAEALFDLIYL